MLIRVRLELLRPATLAATGSVDFAVYDAARADVADLWAVDAPLGIAQLVAAIFAAPAIGWICSE